MGIENTLINEDCLKRLPKIEKNSVDLIITDPPYLMNYKTNYRKNKLHDFCKSITNDNIQNKKVISDSIKESERILKKGGGIYMFCNSNHIDFFKTEIEKYFKMKNILIWVKNNWSAGDLKGVYAKRTEFIIYATKGRRLLNGRRDDDVLYYDRISGKNQVHQNQKPVELLEYLILKSSNPQDIILDMFMGSGSTGVACVNLNRRFIGIELDEKYYEIAKKRIKEATYKER